MTANQVLAIILIKNGEDVLKWLTFSLLVIAISVCGLATPPKENASFDEERFLASLRPAVVFDGERETSNLSERMMRYGISAVSVAVVRDGKLTFTKSYGTLTKGGEQPATTTTLFQAASLSKAITALGILALADDGGFSLDDPVNSHLKGWKLPKGDKVTIADLLSHTGGVNVPSYPGFSLEEVLPSILQILNGAPNSKSKAVGAADSRGKFRYSGGGYMVLQKLIESKTGLSFPRFMARRVFRPSGAILSHFNTLQVDDQHSDIAMGHRYNTEAIQGGWLIYPQAAPAGLWSTPTDLANVLIAFLKAYQGNDQTLFSSALAERLARPIDQNMGLGFGAHGSGRDLLVDHAGWTHGYRSYMVAFPERGDAAVIMTNGNAGNRLIDEMMRSLSSQLGWSAYKPKRIKRQRWSFQDLANLAGQYKMNPAGFTVRLKANGDHLQMTTPRGSTHDLYPVSDNKLIMIEDGEEVTIQLEERTLTFWGMTAKKQD